MNYSHRRPAGWIRDVLIMIAALALMGAAGYAVARLVEKGRPRRAAFNLEMERALAHAVEASIRVGGEVVEEPAVSDLTVKMQERLEDGLARMSSEALEKHGMRRPADGNLPEVRVLIVDSSTVNAVAFPGNLVVLYSGLVKAMNGPEELAGVLAHEIGHCVANDARNALIREVGLSVLLGASGAGSAGELASEVIRGAVRIRYGRRAEERADEFAVSLLASSDLDPTAYSDALRALAETADDAPEWARYIDVHPPLESRIT
ncbi:MAG: M48 family metallopeptidase, partial [Spirochaetaceae bacterium]|nr:M48 family metallopeptidase [Spirochaetaceae bacterium]